MNYKETGIEDLWLFTPKIFEDERGYFYESFNKKDFAKDTGIAVNFVQQNQSKSSYATLRGMHLQKGDAAQAKLMRIIQGEVMDVVVDLRRDSKTFGKWFSTILSGTNKQQLFVPRGIAHGFVVLQPDTIFTYSCDNYYDPASELTLNYKDPHVGIVWPELQTEFQLSEKDKVGMDFETVIEQLFAAEYEK